MLADMNPPKAIPKSATIFCVSHRSSSVTLDIISILSSASFGAVLSGQVEIYLHPFNQEGCDFTVTPFAFTVCCDSITGCIRW